MLSIPTDAYYKLLGRRLRRLRERSGLTQAAFSDLFNMPQQTYHGYETGTRRAPLSFLMRLSDYYSVSFDYLIGMQLNDRVSTLKDHLNMTTEDLSIKSGIPVGTINKILNGETPNPRLSTTAALANALDCTIDYLTGNQNNFSCQDEIDNPINHNIALIIGMNISNLMASKNLNQAELSKILAVSESAVGKWVLGKSIPKMITLEKIAQYFNVQKSDLLNDRFGNSFADNEFELIMLWREASVEGQAAAKVVLSAYKKNEFVR